MLCSYLYSIYLCAFFYPNLSPSFLPIPLLLLTSVALPVLRFPVLFFHTFLFAYLFLSFITGFERNWSVTKNPLLSWSVLAFSFSPICAATSSRYLPWGRQTAAVQPLEELVLR